MKKAGLFATLLAGGLTPAYSATVAISPGTYKENFNGITVASITPAPGWSLNYTATANSLGNESTLGLVRAWNHTATVQFKDVSSNNIPADSTAAAQNANTDRAIALRSGSGFADPGGAFSFNFSTSTVAVDTISIDLLMLDEQSRSTDFTIQYAIGASPTSFNTIGMWSDPGVFGTSTLTFDKSDFGNQLDGQSQVWFRIVALTAATGNPNGATDMIAIDNFSLTASAVPEASSALLGAVGALGLLRRRR